MRQFRSMLADHIHAKKPHIFSVEEQFKEADALTNNFTPRSLQIVSTVYYERNARDSCVSPTMLTSGIV